MDRRLELSKKLKQIIGNDNVYFQPPASVKINYPCIIYEISKGSTKYANDRVYNHIQSYELKFIFKNAKESIIRTVIENLMLSSFDRSYIADGLYHYVFKVYY